MPVTLTDEQAEWMREELWRAAAESEPKVAGALVGLMGPLGEPIYEAMGALVTVGDRREVPAHLWMVRGEWFCDRAPREWAEERETRSACHVFAWAVAGMLAWESVRETRLHFREEHRSDCLDGLRTALGRAIHEEQAKAIRQWLAAVECGETTLTWTREAEDEVREADR